MLEKKKFELHQVISPFYFIFLLKWNKQEIFNKRRDEKDGKLRSQSHFRQRQPPEVFLEILQNLQENTCIKVSFLMKLKALGLQLY